jgi:hypothetical protein
VQSILKKGLSIQHDGGMSDVANEPNANSTHTGLSSSGYDIISIESISHHWSVCIFTACASQDCQTTRLLQLVAICRAPDKIYFSGVLLQLRTGHCDLTGL